MAFTNIVDIIYPIGSVYQTTFDTSPAVLFGGSWNQIKDKFLVGTGDSYAAKDTGGEATHILSVNEMPSHTHYPPVAVTYNGNAAMHRTLFATDSKEWNSGDANNAMTFTGGGQAHNNLPPYYAVSTYTRTQ